MTLSTRDDFVDLLNARQYKTAIEVGTMYGDFARVLLQSNLEQLTLIDDFRNPAMEARSRASVAALIEESNGRARLIEGESVASASLFAPESIDFIYIDAMHEYEYIAADLEAWWPIVSPTGIIAGHDYVLWNTAAGCSCGVVVAVEEFAHRVSRLVHVTGVDSFTAAARLRAAHDGMFRNFTEFPSWWIYK